MNEETRILLVNNVKTEDYMVVSENFYILEKEIDRLNNIINGLEEHCETMLRIFEKMPDDMKQEQLDRYKIYDIFLSKLKKLKENK